MFQRLLPVLLLALGLAGPAWAKGPPKLKVVGPLQAELGDELSDETWKALKAVDRCAVADANWKRAMQPEQQNGIDTLYEMLAAPVTCWQQAVKKGEKAGEQFARVQYWAQANARNVEALRDYLYALQAKFIGDQRNSCTRFKLAIEHAGDAQESIEGLVERYEGTDARTLAGQTTVDVQGTAAAIADEYKTQSCE